MFVRRRAVLGPAALAAMLAGLTAAQGLSTEVVASGFDRPVWAGSPPGDERLFVVEQLTGLVKVCVGGAVLPTPFLDLGPEVAGAEGQQALLGMAFHPKFAQNGYVFVTYTTPSPVSKSFVTRYQVSDADPDVADPASARILLEIDQPAATHNVEHLAFGPLDGYLYVSVGDGGLPHDPGCDGQNPATLLGSVLRIDVDGADPGLNYGIPPDNPFVGQPGFREEIWSRGLRNVWRFSFDRLTGELYLGDVGQAMREEIDFEPALTGGRNYGWPVMEGDLCNGSGIANCDAIAPPDCFAPVYTDPIYVSEHPVNRILIGGRVYRGCRIPSLHGTYVFADKASASYFSFQVAGGRVTDFQDRTAELSGAGDDPVHFGEDDEGELLIVDINDGNVSRVVPAAAPGIADCDGDGLDDECEIATYDHADMDASGVLDTCESFDADTALLCVSTGGTQTLRLHAGSEHGGETYLILGTLSGTSPGTPFGPVTLPLNLDAYSLFTVTNANQPPLIDTVGTLDVAGRATALFQAAAGTLPPSAVGLTAHHAYALFDEINAVTFASNATGLFFGS